MPLLYARTAEVIFPIGVSSDEVLPEEETYMLLEMSHTVSILSHLLSTR